jgi:hypothetical protein
MKYFIFLSGILILIAVVFFSVSQKSNDNFDNKDINNNEEKISLTYATSSSSNNLNNYLDNEFSFVFDYPKEMIVEVVDEDDQNNANILKNLYIKPALETISDRNIMHISVIRGDLNYVLNYFNMSSYEDFSSSTITINSMEGIIVNYRDGFSGESQNDILLNINNLYVLHMSYSKNKSNDVEKFEPNSDFDSILNSIKLAD